MTCRQHIVKLREKSGKGKLTFMLLHQDIGALELALGGK